MGITKQRSRLLGRHGRKRRKKTVKQSESASLENQNVNNQNHDSDDHAMQDNISNAPRPAPSLDETGLVEEMGFDAGPADSDHLCGNETAPVRPSSSTRPRPTPPPQPRSRPRRLPRSRDNATGDATQPVEPEQAREGDNSDSEVPEGHIDILDERLGATKRKLTLQRIGLHQDDDNNNAAPQAQVPAPQYGLIDISCLNSLIQDTLCPTCYESSLKITFDSSYGLAVKMKLVCQQCGNETSQFSSPLHPGVANKQGRRPYDVNRRIAFTLRQIGCGPAELDMFTTYMNMPSSMHHKSLLECVMKISTEMDEFMTSFLGSQAKIIRRVYEAVDEDNIGKEVLDISVSYDGTWQRRGGGGHVSNYGIGFVIEIYSGLAIDYYVMSKYCFGCVNAPEKDTPEFAAWKQKHDPVCQKNYSGSSGNMEVHGAVKIWERSVEKHKFRYTTLIADGDSASCLKLNQLQVYGEGVTIVKEECINHVSKRMGTALINLKKKQQTGERIGGKGGLTDELVKKLSSFFGKAIKDNTHSIPAMKDAIWASFFHYASNDEEPRHEEYCPKGPESWCWYNRAVALHPDDPPPSHKKHVTVRPAVVEKMFPVYERLSKDDLLSKCTHGRTSNSNERLNGKVWEKCPKETFRSKVHIDMAAALAVQEFNGGTQPVDKLMGKLGIPLSETSQASMERRDHVRTSKSDVKVTQEAKQRRKTLKYRKARKVDQDRTKEGAVYGPGLLETLEHANTNSEHSEESDHDEENVGRQGRKKAWPNKGPRPKKSTKK